MIKKLLFVLALLASTNARATNYTICSPDGRLVVTISDDGGKASYKASFDGYEVLKPSNLGLQSNYADFTQGLKITKATESKINKSYDMTRIKASHIEYKANQIKLELVNSNNQPLQIIFNVSNNNIAYRYTLPRPKEDNPKVAVVNYEKSSFKFPSTTTTFLTPQITPMTGWERTKPSYEEDYKDDQPINQKSQFGVGYTFPCLFKIPTEKENIWVLVSETGVTSEYCGSRLSDWDANNGYTITYPQQGEANGWGSNTAAIPLPGNTPWRTITIGNNLKPIVETTIPYDVVDPLYEAKYEYKPGRYTWSWLIWQDTSINYEDQIKFIDLSAKMGYEYVLVDNWWDTQIGYDKIEKLSEYAQSKGVHLMLWYSSNGVENDAPQGPRNIMSNSIARKKEMKWMQKIGIKGIKVDFFGGDKQHTMQLYEDILSDANEYGLQVIFHGCTLPRGWERMYPNYVASEACLASENVFFSDYHAKQEGFEMTMHPFARNAVASFDWGGVIMNRYMSPDNKSRHQRFTSDIFEMATAITNQTSINCVEVTPNGIETLKDFELDWLRQIPTTWDETRFIDGYPTKYAVIARRTGNKWYVGGINGTNKPITLTLNLSMLAGKKVKLYFDKKKAKKALWPEPAMKEINISKNGMTKITIQPMGGIIINSPSPTLPSREGSTN
ncbi:MAG: glycoside hydrolase family 97 protein [Prevotella sp.]|nr:glycoside hydrolase family 97 protein [Prevotella sp.]